MLCPAPLSSLVRLAEGWSAAVNDDGLCGCGACTNTQPPYAARGCSSSYGTPPHPLHRPLPHSLSPASCASAALGTDGQWERAEKVVEWMLRSDIKPNVRTYTALITGAQQKVASGTLHGK